MKILVTGAAGFIGGQLAEHFGSLGMRVFMDVARDDSGATKRWPLSESGLMQTMAGDVPDAIVHAAGSGTVAKVAAQPSLELPANLGALLAVLQYMQSSAPRARLVLLSSAAMYGNAPPTPQTERDDRTPVSLYGLAKAQAEQLASFYATQHGIQATAVRLFSVYGPGLRKQLLWDAMNKFSAGQSTFFGTGQERRDWIHIDDVCRFMTALLKTPALQAFDVFNCGGSPATTSEVLSALAQSVGADAPRFNGQTRAGDPQALLADCSKAERELGWQPTVPWAQGATQYAQWYLNAASPRPARAGPG